MADINSIDFKSFLSNSTNEIFDTMLSMEVEAVESEKGPINDIHKIVGSVCFAGDASGCMNIHVDNDLAKIITGNMLGEDPEDVEEEEIIDVVGELSNMIGGDVKSRLCDAGLPCSLSIPTTISGENFIIESQGWDRHESFTFRSDEHVALVEVYVKSNN